MKILESIESEIDAKNKIDWFRRLNPSASSEAILLDMAKYLVHLQKKYDRQEEFFMAVFGSVALGSIFLGFISLISGNWAELVTAIIVLVIVIAITIYVYGNRKK